MTPKQAILAALNGEITRPQLMEHCGIVNKGGKYVLKRKEAVKKDFVPPTLEQTIAFFAENSYNKDGATKAFKYYDTKNDKGINWVDANGKPVRNWKQKFIANWFKDEYKIKAVQAMHKNIDIDNI